MKRTKRRYTKTLLHGLQCMLNLERLDLNTRLRARNIKFVMAFDGNLYVCYNAGTFTEVQIL